METFEESVRRHEDAVRQHEEHIRELQARGMRVMSPEKVREMVIHIAQSFGIDPAALEEVPEDAMVVSKDGVSISDYIIKRRRGLR